MQAPYEIDTIEDFQKAEEQTAETICTYLVQHLGYEWASDGGIRHQLQPGADTYLSDTDMDGILQDPNPKEALRDYIDVEVALPAKERFIGKTFLKDYQKAFAELPLDVQVLMIQQAKKADGETLPLKKLAARFIDYVNLDLATDDIRNRILFQPARLSVHLSSEIVLPLKCKSFLMELAAQQELDGVVGKAFRQYEWRGSRQHLPQEALPYVEAYFKLIRMRHPQISLQARTEFHYALALAHQMEETLQKDRMAIFSIQGDFCAADQSARQAFHLPLPKGCILPVGDVVSLSANPLPQAPNAQPQAIAFMTIQRTEWKRDHEPDKSIAAIGR